MKEHWSNFWINYGKDIDNLDPQTQVLRTRNKQPISEDLWEYTLKLLESDIEIKANHSLLDLCSGNGLISEHLAKKVQSVTSVDISEGLIESLNSREISNIHTIVSDMRDVSFKSLEFDRVVWYAGIQYLKMEEIVRMFVKIREWMRPGGILFVGDIPDANKLWDYFNTPERKSVYFEGLATKKPIIGSWLTKEWLEHLAKSVGFTDVIVKDQDPKLIYSDFRFDLIARL